MTIADSQTSVCVGSVWLPESWWAASVFDGAIPVEEAETKVKPAITLVNQMLQKEAGRHPAPAYWEDANEVER